MQPVISSAVTLGRIVWYWTQRFVAGGGAELVAHAAIVTDVYGEGDREVVDLSVFLPRGGGVVNYLMVAYSAEPKYGYWTWPPRVVVPSDLPGPHAPDHVGT